MLALIYELSTTKQTDNYLEFLFVRDKMKYFDIDDILMTQDKIQSRVELTLYRMGE